MENKIVIIEGSARRHGDTYRVIQQLYQEGRFEVISLLDYTIGHYDYSNSNAGDDFIPLMESLVEKYDTFLFITPVYWYTMSGRMKVFFDRISDLLHYKKDLGRRLRGKQLAMISVSNADDCIDSFAQPFRASAEYLGMLFIGSVHIWISSNEMAAGAKKRLAQFKRRLLESGE